MRVSYAVRTEESKAVRAWFLKVRNRLRKNEGFVHGDLLPLGKGVYALSIETVVGMFAFTIVPTLMMVLGVLKVLIFGGNGFLIWFGSAWVVIATMTMLPGFHRFLIRLTLRRVTGKWVKVESATEETMWRLVRGKI